MTRVHNIIARNFKRHLMATALTATSLLAASPAFADNWTDHVADQPGGISIDTSVPNTTNIHQHLDQVTVRGDGDINAGWTVNVAQPSSSSRYILFDIENDPTFIRGNLNANGEIYIFDQNGVIFGDTSQVNVGSIVAATGTVADMDQFLNGGKLTIDNVAPGSKIINNGMITAGEAGLVGFVAEGVENNGVINAKMGKVALASGNKVTLDLYGDNLVEIAVDGAMKDALVSNVGTINAEGGTVVLAASAAKSAVENVINMDGIVNVSSATVKGGKIILSGGNKGVVKVAGKLKADGKDGGSVKITGQNILATETAQISANALTAGNGGTVDIVAQKGLVYGGSIEAKGGALSGNGGAVDTSGHDWVDIWGSVDASATNGVGGTWLIDPSNLLITDALGTNVGGNGSSGNPFKPDGDFVSILRTSSIQNALNLGNSVRITTVGTPAKFGQDGTILVDANITKTAGGNATLLMEAAGSIIINAGKTISSTVGQLNVQLDAMKSIFMGGTINTNGGNTTWLADDSIFADGKVNANGGWIELFANDEILTTGNAEFKTTTGRVEFQAGNNVTLGDNTAIETNGGNVFVTAINGNFWNNVNSTIKTNGGNVQLRADGTVNNTIEAIYKGRIWTNGVIDAQGGNIDLHQSSVFVGNNNTLRTSGTGTITMNQNKWGAIGNLYFAVNALQNTGTGVNTITAGAGTFYESLTIDQANVHLKGANAGVAGNGARGAETIIAPNSPGVHVVADNVTVDGVTISGASGPDGYGVWVDNVSNTKVINNIINNTSQAAIFAQNANGLEISTNLIKDTAAGWNKSGINISGGSAITIDRNEMTNIGGQAIFAEGPYAGPATQLDITNNTITNSEFNGIYVKKWNGANIEGNTIDGVSNGGHGVQLELTNNTDVTGNTISNAAGAGINLYYGNDTTKIQTNTLTDNKIGVQLENVGGGSTNTTIGDTLNPALGNTITGGMTGVLVNGGGNLIVGSNIISGQSDAGIDVKNSAGDFNIVYFNKVNGTGNDGIRVLGTNGVLLSDNRVGLASPVGGNGISVTTSDNAQILSNTVGGATKDGIKTEGGKNLSITDNTIYGTGLMGINVNKAKGATIMRNTVYGTGDDGINLTNSSGALVVSRNTIGKAGAGGQVAGNGIHIFNSHGATVQRNSITHINVVDENIDDYNGIYIERSNNTMVGGVGNANGVTGARDGIKINGGTGNSVISNIVNSSKRIGIYAEASFNTDILFNTVFDSNLTGFGGITVAGGNNHRAVGNTVWGLDTSKATSGIHFFNVTDGNNEIRANKVYGINGIGIKTENVQNIGVTGNTVYGTKDDGISLTHTLKATVTGNTIGTAAGTIAGNGIHLFGSHGAVVQSNKISKINIVDENVDDYNGIYVERSDNVVVGGVDGKGNSITGARDGIKVNGAKNTDVIANNIVSSRRIGIYSEASFGTDILFNSVFDSNLPGFGGITVAGGNDHRAVGNTVWGLGSSKATSGIHFFNLMPGNNEIRANYVHDVNGDGIKVQNAPSISIKGNTVKNATASGIYLNNVQSALVDANKITNSGLNGLYAAGANNGDIIVSGNTFTDNPIGANFESGRIDFTVPSPNFFVRGNVGLRFAPFAPGTPLSLVDDDAPGVDAFDPGFVTPTNYGGTIGAQNFTGQTQYYVQLDNGAFYTPGTPTWLNGLNSTYDTFTPSAYGPDYIIPADDLNNLNAKFYHYPNGLIDGKDLGVFFYGRLAAPVVVPLAADINQNQIFNTFDAFNGDVTGLNIQIRGLPSIPGGSTAANLNNLVPFAGGQTASNTAAGLNAIETAAGEKTPQATAQSTTTASAENLSEIETAAGAQDQTCWGDAAAMAGNGQIVNVVYGGSMDDNLAQAAACGGSF